MPHDASTIEVEERPLTPAEKALAEDMAASLERAGYWLAAQVRAEEIVLAGAMDRVVIG